MELVVNVKNKEELNKIKEYSNYILLDDPDFSNYSFLGSDIYELIESASKAGLKSIIKLNNMIHPDELENVRDKLLSYMKYDCLFLATDLGVCNIAIKLGIENRVIYDPVTMITNSLDAKIYSSFGFNALGLSEEITLADLNTIIEKTNIDAYYQIFGYHLMMHSKRKLISLYSEFKNIDIKDKCLELKEQTREDRYPILENNHGTFIFRSYVISLLKELKNLKAKYGVIDSFNLDFDTYLGIAKLFHNYNNNLISLEEALNLLNSYNIKIEDGFSYKDSEYKKEEFFN